MTTPLELIRGLTNIRASHQGCAVTIGNFDGIHIGHASIIDSLRATARELSAKTCVISFEPLPMEYFATSDNMPPRLTWFRQKYRQLQHHHCEQLLLMHFNQQLAATPAHEFVQQVLIDGLKIRHLLVGDDFRFGTRREGDINLLREASKQHGFTLQQADTCLHLDERVSSTRIRTLLKAGNLDTAATLLGRPYAIQGRVKYGAQLGRTIGFPTANIVLGGSNPPMRGVFAVTVCELDSTDTPSDIIQRGIANLGEKPTVDGRRLSLEVHVLDFAGNLYGKRLRVQFHQKLRDEKKFDSLDALKQGIANDEAAARQWFAAHNIPVTT